MRLDVGTVHDVGEDEEHDRENRLQLRLGSASLLHLLNVLARVVHGEERREDDHPTEI
jgi:hypothetical protein